MQRLNTTDSDFAAQFDALVNARRESDADVSADVSRILADVKARGDEALAEYSQRFDSYELANSSDWVITAEACRAAHERLDSTLRDALELAAQRIRAEDPIS